jgi:hypothetical protein
MTTTDQGKLKAAQENIALLRQIADEQVLGMTAPQRLMLDTLDALTCAVTAIAEQSAAAGKRAQDALDADRARGMSQ